MTVAVLLLGVALLIFYARAPDDERLDEHVHYDVGTAEERAHLRRQFRMRGFSKQDIERFLRNDRQIRHVQALRAIHGRDPFPSRALAKKG